MEPVKDDLGKVEGLVFSLVETTQRKRVNEALKKNSDAISIANEKLRVVGGLTRYDVGNKLSAILSYTYLLKKKYADQSDIVEGLGKMERVVADSVRIFEFAKIY